MRTAIRVFLTTSTVALALALPGIASAQTFCVHNPAGCAGTPYNNLSDALANAWGNGPGRDTVVLGAGTFVDGPAADKAGSPVDIVGQSPGLTILEGTTNLKPILDIEEPTSTVSNLQLKINGNVIEGMTLAGSADNVTVTSSGATGTITGVTLIGSEGRFDNSTVDLDYGPNQLATAVAARATGDVGTVTGSNLRAMRGASAIAGGTLEVHRSRLYAWQGLDVGTDGFGLVADSLIVTPGAHPSDYAPSALAADGDGSQLEATRVTAIGDGGQYTDAFYTGLPYNKPNASAYMDVSNSVFSNYGRLGWLAAPSGTAATLNTQYCAYDHSKQIHIDPGATHNSAHDLDIDGIDPGFYDPATNTLGLKHDSPLIDAGDPGAASDQGDLLGNDRVRPGPGKGTARLDIGALEYQNKAPAVSAVAMPASAGVGEDVTFVANAKDADVTDTFSYSWKFDDGATADGPSASHAFSTPGDHTASVVVKDETGLSTQATATVTIAAPPADTGDATDPAAPASGPADPSADPGAGDPPAGVTPAGAGALTLTALRLAPNHFRARRGTTVKLTLSRAATVVFKVTKRRGHRWVKAGSITRRFQAGTVTMRLRGRIAHRRLALGRYRLVAQAHAGATASRAVDALFRVW